MCKSGVSLSKSCMESALKCTEFPYGMLCKECDVLCIPPCDCTLCKESYVCKSGVSLCKSCKEPVSGRFLVRTSMLCKEPSMSSLLEPDGKQYMAPACDRLPEPSVCM